MPEAVFQPFPMLPARRAQVWRYRPEFRRPRHFHREPELNFIVQGSATLGVGTRVQHALAGDVVVFEPGQDHVLLEASDDLELFTLALTPELWERRLAADAVAPPKSEAQLDTAQADIAEALDAMADVRDPLSVETRLSDLFCQLRTLARAPSSVSRRAALGARARPGASCSTLASQLGTHPTHLSRVVTRELGVPLVELRSRLKLSEFVRLVDAGQSFTQAALQADFGSYAQCHRVFRRFTGCPPRAYFAGARAAIDLATATRKAGRRG
jgi:AraC-like DNA-binding protein/mannose-6-phosphate isomerase-like protein (cupin superfamily)